uniref:Uncharacterized protein n=1 Tax=Branchiostoma floridae TaxID=7739 RepID=C3Z7U7_BRAFL|eukprot:XP_002595440.1 hypothetical protein BRAFLDRAFT_69272 [Branchiostoma floridae]
MPKTRGLLLMEFLLLAAVAHSEICTDLNRSYPEPSRPGSCGARPPPPTRWRAGGIPTGRASRSGTTTHTGPAETPWGDTATDSYHKYATDVQLGADMGMTAYRFSISWPRLLPDGTLAGGINQAGVDYYNKLIDELIAHKMEPLVTMYHWDLPQALQTKYGGWTNESMVDYFNDYATLCFQKFGDRVKRWATFNEPWSFIVPGYGLGVSPPQMLFGMRRRQYEVAHVVIKAHARAWHTYNDTFRAQQGGQVGIVLGAPWGQPRNTSDPRDVQAADNFEQFFLGWFANPIYGNGDYPDAMKQMINGDSTEEPRLPVFSDAEKAYVRGAADFAGLNMYSAYLIYASNHTLPLDFISAVIPDLKGAKDTEDPTWPHVPFYITETGISEKEQFPPNMNDTWRQCYYMLYVDEAIRAIKLDGRDVRGFFAWTLMDNIEWGSGHSVRLGLHYTNFSDPNLTRTPRVSAKLYGDIARSGGFPEGAAHRAKNNRHDHHDDPGSYSRHNGIGESSTTSQDVPSSYEADGCHPGRVFRGIQELQKSRRSGDGTVLLHREIIPASSAHAHVNFTGQSLLVKTRQIHTTEFRHPPTSPRND